MVKKFLSFVILFAIMMLLSDKVSARMLTINDVNQKLTTYLNEFNTNQNMNLSTAINTSDSTLDIFDSTEKIGSIRYTDEYIEYNNRNIAITEENVSKYNKLERCIDYIYKSIVQLSGYNWFFKSEEINYSNTYDELGLEFDNEEFNNSYYFTHYKMSLNTEKIGAYVSEYGSAYDCIDPDPTNWHTILKFEVNGGNSIDDYRYCSACKTITVGELPVAKREGYEFEGWYLDKALTLELIDEGSTSSDPVYFDDSDYRRLKDSNNCEIGEDEITIYAKWKKVQKVSVPNTGIYLNILKVLLASSFLMSGVILVLYIKKKKID